MPAPTVIIHERVDRWAAQLRPRFPGRAIRWAETRSTADLLRASGRSSHPILILEIDGSPTAKIHDLGQVLQFAPTTLSLVIEPRNRPEVVELCRELGATIVLTGVVVPPDVENLLRRWLDVADHRAKAAGWFPTDPDPEPWDQPELFAAEL